MAYALHHRAAKQKACNSAHYQNNKDTYKQNVSRQRNRAKEFIQNSKIKCARCPETFHRCLEYHHLNDKEFSVSRGSKRGMSIERIQEEIDKCILLCANCHRKETFAEDFAEYMRLR